MGSEVEASKEAKALREAVDRLGYERAKMVLTRLYVNAGILHLLKRRVISEKNAYTSANPS